MTIQDKSKRRKWFFKHSMQNMYVGQLFFAVTIPMFIIAVIVYMTVWSTSFVIFDQIHLIPAVRIKLIHSTNSILLSFVPGILIGVIAWTVFISGRLAGPLFRLTTDLKKVLGSDKKGGIKLREDDLPELKTIVRQINHLIEESGKEKT